MIYLRLLNVNQLKAKFVFFNSTSLQVERTSINIFTQNWRFIYISIVSLLRISEKREFVPIWFHEFYLSYQMRISSKVLKFGDQFHPIHWYLARILKLKRKQNDIQVEFSFKAYFLDVSQKQIESLQHENMISHFWIVISMLSPLIGITIVLLKSMLVWYLDIVLFL